jgi:VWFA-related protein
LRYFSMKTLTVALLLIIGLLAPTSLGQTPPAQGQEEEKVVVGTNEVVLDAVVKDKKGHAVRDLKSSDFEVYEDGVPQQVLSFRLITRDGVSASTREGGATTSSSSASRTGGPFDNTNRIGAVALVFDRLSPDARARARQAAFGYLGQALRPEDFVGVFGIDLSLRVVQSFTNDERLVRQAIERASAHDSAAFASNTEQTTNLSQKEGQLQTQRAELSTNVPDTSGGQRGALAVEQAFNEMTLRAVEGFDRLEREQQGHATTDGLLAIINAMSRLPGRKALIFFSEGVAIPQAVQAHFRSVISSANRSNVSIYAVDAAGLRALSSDAETGRALAALGAKRSRQGSSPTDDTSGPMSRDLERNEDLMRANPDAGLGQLANGTGGLLISDTNNPGARLHQVDEDMHTYYVLTYTPTNQNYDGRFRQVGVKVSRAGVDVQARKGYYAINSSSASPVLAYEAPALAILGGSAQPNAFPIRAAAYSFPEPNRPGLVPVMVELPAGAVSFIKDDAKKIYRTDFSVVVLIKDESQHVVKKLSNQYLLSGPLEKLESARGGMVLFYRETDLAPGRYTVASVVYDAATSQASTKTSTVVVPDESSTRLRMSSVILIKNAERLPSSDHHVSNPFHFGDVIVYPNLGEPVRKSAVKELNLFVTVYPPKGAPTPLKLNCDVTKGGRLMGRATLTLPDADPNGRIQYASAVSIDKLKPGDYDLKVTVQDAQSSATRFEHFTVKP